MRTIGGCRGCVRMQFSHKKTNKMTLTTAFCIFFVVMCRCFWTIEDCLGVCELWLQLGNCQTSYNLGIILRLLETCKKYSLFFAFLPRHVEVKSEAIVAWRCFTNLDKLRKEFDLKMSLCLFYGHHWPPFPTDVCPISIMSYFFC